MSKCDNHQLGKLELHIYAVADVAYHAMLQRKESVHRYFRRAVLERLKAQTFLFITSLPSVRKDLPVEWKTNHSGVGPVLEVSV